MSGGRLRAISGSSNGSYKESMKKTALGGRTVPCRHWVLKGYCDLKDDCKFAHGDREGLGGGGAAQFKTKLCRIFLQSGSCPNGFSCSFAHGDSDLRTVWPGSGRTGTLRFPGDNMKTVMCKNWVELGTCSFGDKCTFAHSEEQIKSGKEQKMIFQNPLYKTTLCKQYNEGEFCELGDNCHFAHGPDELRTLKPIEKADPASDPSFKTVLCKNWEEIEGSCEYGDSCRFAHGKEDLRPLKPNENPVVAMVNKNMSPQYKTVLCSNHQDCKFGTACNFAHSELELRTVQQNLAEINPNYKGTLCKYYMTTGQCEFGSICQYAHGEAELRRNANTQQTVPTKQNYNNSFPAEAHFSSPQFKTILCKNFEDSGKCDFASRCQFAHGEAELRTVPQNYLQLSQQKREAKELCKVWLQTGHCRRAHCDAAHCLNELSTTSQQLCRNIRERGYCMQGPSCQSCHSRATSHQPPPSPSPKPVKVVLCQGFSQAGHCDRGHTCTFAHGLEELHQYRTRQVPNYRTTLCQTWSSSGQCKYGETCMYAHGHLQLRSKAILGAGLDIFSSPSGVPDCKRIKY